MLPVVGRHQRLGASLLGSVRALELEYKRQPAEQCQGQSGQQQALAGGCRKAVERLGGEQRQRRYAGQDVGPDDVARGAEEEQRREAPRQQVQLPGSVRRRLAGWLRFPPPVPRRRRQQQRPRQQRHRGEEPDGAGRIAVRRAVQIALPTRRHEPVPVLADQEVAQEARRAPLRQHEPGNDEQGDEGRAGGPGKRPPDRVRSALDHGPAEQRQADQDQRDRSLGQHTDGDAGEQPPALALPLRRGPVQATPEAGHRERRAQHQRCVGHDGARRHIEQGRTDQQAQHEPSLRVRAAHCKPPGQPGHARRAQEVRQPGGELVDAEQFEAEGGEPEGQRRLGPERHPVVGPGGDPVPPFHHLAADLGIARFGRVHQRQQAHCGQPRRDQQAEQQQHAARGIRRRPAHQGGVVAGSVCRAARLLAGA